MSKRVLVTGGAGFIGSRLCARLLQEGYDVISLDNYFAGSRENHIQGVEYREGHTKNIAQHVSESVDLIFHLGEYARVEQSVLEKDIVHDLNTVGTEGVIAFWQKQKCKLVYAGSSTKFSDTDFIQEAVPYVATKAQNTERIRVVGEQHNLPYAITYFYNVYGPGERSGVYGTVIESFRAMYASGMPLTVTRPGTQKRNFTHVDDIVDGLLLVAQQGHGDEYGLGSDTSYSILEVAKMFQSELVFLPERKANRTSSRLDASKTHALGWRAVRSLETYIEDYVRVQTPHARKEKRVLVFSTTFFPVAGPAEDALLALIREMPDVHFDVITTCFSRGSKDATPTLSNMKVHRVGFGTTLDKFLLPILGYQKAHELSQKHTYLFAWSIMASYAMLAAVFAKKKLQTPLLVTFADQEIHRLSLPQRMTFRSMLTGADQVYGISADQEAAATYIFKKSLARNSFGEVDAFANQLRYSYATTLVSMSSHKKRILIFSLNYYPQYIGGAEVAIKEITDRISEEEIEFHMVTLRFDDNLPRVEKVGNVLVHRIGFTKKGATIAELGTFPLHLNKYWYQLAAFFKAYELQRIFKYDAIWAMMAHSCGIPAGLFKQFHPQVKYVLTLQEGDPPEHIERMMRPVMPLFKQGFTRADALQPISTFLRTWGNRMGFVGDSEVIPNAVDVALFTKPHSEQDLLEMKKTLRKKEGDVYLVTTSRLVHKNAIDDVINALALLPKNVSFLIYGIGPDEEKLKALAKKQGVEARARFMGQITHAQMPLMLAACDIFIRPSRSEGMGNSFIEAMAAGLPVIATQEGGISDFLFDAKRNPVKETTGWAVDKDSPEQIVAAVQDIIGHPDTVATVTTRAKALAKEKYDWTQIAKSMKSLFDQLIQTR